MKPTINALRNRANAILILTRAGEFLAAAEDAKRRGHAGPSVENLFSAAELTARAQLISMVMDPSTKSHGTIHSKLNQQRKLGNADSAFTPSGAVLGTTAEFIVQPDSLGVESKPSRGELSRNQPSSPPTVEVCWMLRDRN